MPVSITAPDITGVWRPLSDREAGIVPGLSTQAWVRLLDKRPDLEGLIAAGTITVDSVKSAMVSMVIRVLKNIDSVRTISNSYDDWSESQTLDSSISTGELYVNDHELGLVTPASTVPEYGAYSVSLWGDG
ncbi:hypothetical protein [Zhihengliuella sp.]|uniref:hypothetical protein n=1 Tax=Zhihengliuella sp. TaxID=1954483 RepID=UPI002811A75C|nr:hypothetical protein [Zhihengliuella sp.]